MPHRSCERLLVLVRLAACLLLAQTVLSGQEPALPTGRDLVARHVAAIGGEAAHKAVKSIRLKGRFEVTGQNLSADFETIAARPAKLHMQVNVPGMGLVQTGYNGAIGWSMDSQLGPRVVAGRELLELAADADFDATLHLPSQIKELTTLGKTEFDRRPAYKVRVVLTSGVEQTEYFDAETGFEIGWEATRATPIGVVPTSATQRDYKKFGSLMHPTILIQHAMLQEQILRVTSVEYDVVSESAFELPPQIKALVK